MINFAAGANLVMALRAVSQPPRSAVNFNQQLHRQEQMEILCTQWGHC